MSVRQRERLNVRGISTDEAAARLTVQLEDMLDRSHTEQRRRLVTDLLLQNAEPDDLDAALEQFDAMYDASRPCV